VGCRALSPLAGPLFHQLLGWLRFRFRPWLLGSRHVNRSERIISLHIFYHIFFCRIRRGAYNNRMCGFGYADYIRLCISDRAMHFGQQKYPRVSVCDGLNG
jgi:hypothetical protein